MNGLSLFLGLCVVVFSLQGCGSDAQAQAIEGSDFEVLASGEDPMSGYDKAKQIRVIDNETDFSLYWYDYTSETEPDVDFNNETVVIYDQGWIDGNSCSSYARISSTESSTDDDNRITVLEIGLTQQCTDSDIACPTVTIDSRPYRIFKVPKTRELFVAEEITINDC